MAEVTITLRQYYAGQVLAGLMANPDSIMTDLAGQIHGVLDPQQIAFDKADKMLEWEREHPQS